MIATVQMIGSKNSMRPSSKKTRRKPKKVTPDFGRVCSRYRRTILATSMRWINFVTTQGMQLLNICFSSLSGCRYLKDEKLKPLEGKQLPYLTNAGAVADEDAEFKEYPISADKKTWFKSFGGHPEKMLGDIEKRSGLRASVSCCRLERVGCLSAMACECVR